MISFLTLRNCADNTTIMDSNKQKKRGGGEWGNIHINITKYKSVESTQMRK